MRLNQITEFEMMAVDKFVSFLKKEFSNNLLMLYALKKATKKFEKERVVEMEEVR